VTLPQKFWISAAHPASKDSSARASRSLTLGSANAFEAGQSVKTHTAEIETVRQVLTMT
jgi:hypothetical protein